jgi:hypothetical protein
MSRWPCRAIPAGAQRIDASGKVYRYWFADEVYKKHLDAPNAKPVETYGKKAP